MIRKYILNVLLALDYLAAALIGFDPRMTISSVLALYRKKCKTCKFICRVLDKIDSRHCEDSITNWSDFRKYDRSIWKTPSGA